MHHFNQVRKMNVRVHLRGRIYRFFVNVLTPLSYVQTGKHRRIHVSSILVASSPNTAICICIHVASDVACPN
jgi:hypothetical protein